MFAPQGLLGYGSCAQPNKCVVLCAEVQQEELALLASRLSRFWNYFGGLSSTVFQVHTVFLFSSFFWDSLVHDLRYFYYKGLK